MERVRMITLVLVVIMMMGFAEAETMHKVGDSLGWNQHTNYTLWSSHQHFYLGNWLYFMFDKRYYNVLEVNETSYQSCNDKDFIFNITRGGRDVFQLTEPRPYYFLTSGGYCFQGMKLAVNVSLLAPVKAPAPAPAKNGSPTSNIPTRRSMIFLLISSTTLVWAILFKA